MKIKPLPFILIGLCLVTMTRSGVALFDHHIFASFAADAPIHKEEDPMFGNSNDSDTKQIDVRQKLLDFQKDQKGQKNTSDYALKEAKPENMQDIKKICITGNLLEAAEDRLDYLEKKEAEIIEQARLIEASDRRVREQVAKLKIIKDTIVEQAKLAGSKIAKESKRLISIYEKMNPKSAAAIFNKMAPSVAAELLRNMKEDQSSAILSKMLPKVAYEVTLSLAKGIENTQDKYKKMQ